MLPLLFLIASSVLVHAQVLTVKAGDSPQRQTPTRTSVRADSVFDVSVEAQLLEAPIKPAADGKLLLVAVFAEEQKSGELSTTKENPQRLVIRLPLSSSQEAYGEDRSCVVRERRAEFTFTAGEDEKNFVPFGAMSQARDFQFAMNKYLCRALAAPFQCSSGTTTTSAIRMQPDMKMWKMIEVYVELEGTGDSARVQVQPVKVTRTGTTFDYGSCAIIAPSNGMCCVQHKTTEWHCGGQPTGDGWHQVSGDCFHRETGGSCKE